MEALLVKNDTWKYVNGENVKPAPIEGNAERENAIREWIIADQKARADLILAMNPSELK